MAGYGVYTFTLRYLTVPPYHKVNLHFARTFPCSSTVDDPQQPGTFGTLFIQPRRHSRSVRRSTAYRKLKDAHSR